MLSNVRRKTGAEVNLYLFCFMVSVFVLGIPAASEAHWCSNIYNTYARIVVKPERNEINISDGESGTLKVKVRNNFPYTLEYLRLFTDQPTGLSIDVTPSEKRPLYTGEEATFTLNITRNGGQDQDVSALNLRISTRVEAYQWSEQDLESRVVRQDPDPQTVRSNATGSCQQYCELSFAKLYDLDCVDCEPDGLDGLLLYWKDRTNNCTGTSFDVQPDQEALRAGQALAILLRFRSPSADQRTEIIQAFLDAMDSQHEITRGMAAFFAAYGTSDASVVDRVGLMATTDPDSGGCGISPNDRAKRLAKAAILAGGDDQYLQDVTSCMNDSGEEGRVRAACAAALGIMGQDDPITRSGGLIDFVPTGASGGTNETEYSDYRNNGGDAYGRLIASALLQLTALVRRGGPEGMGIVSFYPEEAVDDNVAPRPPTGLTVEPVN